MKKIERYAKKSVNKLDLSLKEKKELEVQFIDHMTEMYNNHKLDGFTENESIDYAIAMFKEGPQLKEEKYKSLNKVLILIFGIYCVIFTLIYIYVSRQDIFKHRFFDIRLLIPFNYLSYHITQIINYNSIQSIIELKRQVPLFLAFIPIGFFIPILTSKYKSFISNFKKFIYITFSLQVIKIIIGFGVFRMDYMLIHLFACLIGYVIFKFTLVMLENKNKLRIIQ
ncbi:MAG: hypothetical protein KH415_22280 [Clostridium sp.]|nr:hypothetical protein [Clostridium sp.]